MGEKRGQTEKLKYDFNTARAVYFKRGEKYSRVTERDFRSFCGERYIMIDGEYIPYEGPIYYWNSNKICPDPIEGKIQYLSEMPFNSQLRPGEKYLL